MNGTLILILVSITIVSIFALSFSEKQTSVRDLPKSGSGPTKGEKPGTVPKPAPVENVFVRTDFQDGESEKFKKQCIAIRGVVNSAGNVLKCLAFESGGELLRQTPAVTTTPATLVDYLMFTYPLYPSWKTHSNEQLQTFFSSLQFSYFPSNFPTNRVQEKPFFNTDFVEVLALEESFKNMDFNTWKATKYSIRTGTGWFLPVRASLMAYNSLHLLCLCSAQDSFVLENASTDFAGQLSGNNLQQLRQQCQSPSAKISWMSRDDKPRRYICQLAAQRGYQTIQLGFEWVDDKYESFLFDLVDPNFSCTKLTRKNPFSIKENANENYLYLDSFLDSDVVRVDPKYVNDPNPKTLGERYGDFSFKARCHDQKGTISIDYFLTQCLKILRFGSPALVLDVERDDIDFSKYPQSTELEKMQSYFTLVYGNADVWKRKNLAELTDYWQKCEIHYTSCPIFPTTAYPKPSIQLSYINYQKPPIDAYQFPNRGAEAVQYVEVIRTNLRYSWYEATNMFAATFFYPVRGSGLFLPTGKMFVAADKESAAATLGIKLTYKNSYEQDVELVKALLYKGYDTFYIYYIYGHTEIISLKDPIAAQMSLIRTHPWDPIISVPNSVVTEEPYFPSTNLLKSCIASKQFSPPGTCNAPCVASSYSC